MAARKKTTSRSRSISAPTFFTKDLFIFIAIMAVVAIVTYILTYKAITAKFDQQIGNTYDAVQVESIQGEQ